MPIHEKTVKSNWPGVMYLSKKSLIGTVLIFILTPICASMFWISSVSCRDVVHAGWNDAVDLERLAVLLAHVALELPAGLVEQLRRPCSGLYLPTSPELS